MSTKPTRPYASAQRDQTAQQTRLRILAAAKNLFTARGIEAVRLTDIAATADVAASTIYGIFKSREGILRALMETALFGPAYAAALTQLDGVTDPLQLISLTPAVSRAIYEAEVLELGLMRDIAAYSPSLRAMELEFETIRYAAQELRITRLFAAGRARDGLTPDQARRILWMYTSRDIYRMLVTEGGWTPDAYEKWLTATLLTALVKT